MIKEKNLDPSLISKIQGASLHGAANQFYVCKDGGQPNTYWGQRVPSKLYSNPSSGAGTAITKALAAAVSGQNDVINLSPDSHNIGTGLTWNKNMTHLIGMYPEQRMNMRSRIGMTATIASMLTVSGYGNLLANLYFMYGLDNATDLNLLTVTGDRNSFVNCHFGGPMHVTPADEATFNLINLACGEVFFKNCTFGIETVLWTDGDMLRFYGAADRSLRAIFENCIFLMRADNNQVNFITTVAGMGNGFAIFKNCLFINLGTTLTLAVDGAGVGTAFKTIMDINTTIVGATDVITEANEATVFMGHGNFKTGADEDNGLACSPDHTA